MPRSLVRSLTVFGASRRTRWNADQARLVLARLDRSGLTVKEFAAREGLDRQRLYRWRAQLNGKGAEPTGFVEIVPAALRSCIEVVTPSGHVVRVPDGCSEDTLGRVFRILDERC
jgi:hypothetical protein